MATIESSISKVTNVSDRPLQVKWNSDMHPAKPIAPGQVVYMQRHIANHLHRKFPDQIVEDQITPQVLIEEYEGEVTLAAAAPPPVQKFKDPDTGEEFDTAEEMVAAVKTRLMAQLTADNAPRPVGQRQMPQRVG